MSSTRRATPLREFVFKIGSTLTTPAGATVSLINGASPCNVYWQVGSSATLGTNTFFVGNILAQASITAVTGASISGRALARTGTVTLDTNAINAPLGMRSCSGQHGDPDLHGHRHRARHLLQRGQDPLV